MAFNLIPETNSIKEILTRPTFTVSYLSTTMAIVGGSYVMEKMRIEDTSAPALLVHSVTYFDVLSFTVFLGAIAFSNSQQITHAVAMGRSPRVSLERLQRLPWPLNITCGSYGDRSIFKFVIQVFCFPGIAAVMTLYLLSIYVNGIEDALEWRMPLGKYLACSSLWRLLVGSAVYTLNYIAAHNPTQSVLAPSEDADAATTTVAAAALPVPLMVGKKKE